MEDSPTYQTPLFKRGLLTACDRRQSQADYLALEAAAEALADVAVAYALPTCFETDAADLLQEAVSESTSTDYTEAISGMVAYLLSEHAKDLHALTGQIKQAEAQARADLAGLLQEWMDTTAPHPLERHVYGYLNEIKEHTEFFRLKAAACGLPWPLAQAGAGITPKGGQNNG